MSLLDRPKLELWGCVVNSMKNTKIIVGRKEYAANWKILESLSARIPNSDRVRIDVLHREPQRVS